MALHLQLTLRSSHIEVTRSYIGNEVLVLYSLAGVFVRIYSLVLSDEAILVSFPQLDVTFLGCNISNLGLLFALVSTRCIY